MDLKVPIRISDELSEDVVSSTGQLDLASGDIQRIEYEDYDVAAQGLPWESEDYEFTCGILTNNGKDVEFKIDVNKVTGQYSVSPNELLEIKVRAAALFAGITGGALLEGSKPKPAAGEAKPRGGRKGRAY